MLRKDRVIDGEQRADVSFAALGRFIEAAVTAYAADVRSRRFPGKQNVYAMRKGAKA